MKKRFYFLLIVIIFSTSEKNYAAVGEGISERGILSSQSPIKFIPIAKYKYDQSGTQGIALGAKIVGLMGPFSGDFWPDLLGYIGKYLVNKDIKLWLEILLGKTPENVVIGFKYTENDSKIVNNDDIIFLLEYNENLEIGKPIKIYMYPGKYDGGSEIVPPSVGNILYTQDIAMNGIGDFKTVSEAFVKMGPQIQWLNENFYFHTVGVVNGYTVSKGKLYMILKQYGLLPWPISGMTSQMSASFIPVDVSSRTNFPEVGSVVKVGGLSKRLPSIIRQTYEWWYDLKCIYALIPSEFEILNGRYMSNLPLETSLLFVFLTNDGYTIGFNWPGENGTAPDFTLNPIVATPNELMKIGSTYTITTRVYNNGNIAGDCTVKFYNSVVDQEHLIGEVNIQNLQPNNYYDANIQWQINQFDLVPFRPFFIYAIAENSSKFEYNQANNLVYLERYLASNNSYVEISAYCPVSLKITADDGKIVDTVRNEIPGSLYQVDDYNFDYNLDHRVYLPSSYSTSQYQIEVLPDSGATEEDTFTLTSRFGNEPAVLADSMQINEIPSNPFVFTITGIRDLKETPKNYSLKQNYPNPANPTTIIKFDLPYPGNVKLTLYNLLGEEVMLIVDEFKEAGSHEVEVKSQKLTSGVYLYKLQTENYIEVRKMQILK